MADTYYDSELTGEEIEAALNAINGVIAQTNNGKVLAIENGKIVAKSVSEWIDPHILEPLTVTENGDYYPEGDVDGFDEVHLNVPGETPVLEHLSVTANGTYTPEIGVDGFDEVTVSVPSSGTNVYYGYEDPASSLGEDGDIYIKYGSSVTEINGIIVDSDFVVANTTQILSTHSVVFKKTSEDPCIAIEMFASPYYGPMLLSPTADGAKYTNNLSPNAITVDGRDWYISSGIYWTTGIDAPTIQEYYDEAINIGTAEGRINTARLMLRLASENIPVSKVFKKIGSSWKLLLKETVLQAKTTTVNGIVRADAGYDGLSYVDVNVSGGGDSDKYLLSGAGRNYFNLGLPCNDRTLKVEISFILLSNLERGIFGGNWSTDGFFLMCINNRFRYHTGNAVLNTAFTVEIGKEYNIVADYNGIEINGEYFQLSPSVNNTSANLSICSSTLFPAGYGDSLTALYKRVKVYSNNAPVFDLSPADDDGTPCFKDAISGDMIYNSGTGTVKIL